LSAPTSTSIEPVGVGTPYLNNPYGSLDRVAEAIKADH